jgi:hypothetical protein
VASRYDPLVLPVPLHDLPENYMKNLSKFIGEGDLTVAEHINFFDQLADILGIEHEYVYSRLLVQTFEGQGLAKLLTESNLKPLRINQLQENEGFLEIGELDVTAPTTGIQGKFSTSVWYHNIVSCLLNLQCPNELTPSKTRTLKLHIVKYCIIDVKLYWKDPLGFLLSYLVEAETKRVIDEFHVGVCGGHHAW